MSGIGEILIVDDVPEQITFAGSILREAGYKVHAVTSGKAALSYLERHQPDLVMLDIKMADMNGLDVCRKIKSDEMTANIPVIFFTSDESPDTIRRGFEAGCCDYVLKPFIREEYLARVKTHIEIARKTIELENANSELKMFTSAVSHDLRSPLSVIKMLIDTLEDELENGSGDDVKQIMGMLKGKSAQTLKMTEHLLEFSRVCNAVPKTESIDLDLLVDDVCNELVTLEPERKITLDISPLPTVYGDSVLIRLLFRNLLSNAFKFTRNRENAEITISVSEDQKYNIVSVKDNGAGFDMKYYDRLFVVFRRLHSDEFEGSGVGLALCERIIKRHGGKIEAIGAPNKGAVFKVFFRK
ncbi:MAG: response regulator [Oscillospiraceae bacterium]